jgi:hypothetical protein
MRVKEPDWREEGRTRMLLRLKKLLSVPSENTSSENLIGESVKGWWVAKSVEGISLKFCGIGRALILA